MSKFGDAFAAARKAGKSEFPFNGKIYNTKMASEGKSGARSSSAASQGGSDKETSWADAGKAEADRLGTKSARREAAGPPAPTNSETKGWKDPGEIENKNREAGYAFKRGGAVKKPSGPATIGVTRSNRMYAKGGAVKKGCK